MSAAGRSGTSRAGRFGSNFFWNNNRAEKALTKRAFFCTPSLPIMSAGSLVSRRCRRNRPSVRWKCSPFVEVARSRHERSTASVRRPVYGERDRSGASPSPPTGTRAHSNLSLSKMLVYMNQERDLRIRVFEAVQQRGAPFIAS